MAKKKILVANRRYFPSTGPERYMFNISALLEHDGFEVVPFSVKREQNLPTPYSDYFVNPPYGENVLYYQDAKLSLWQKLSIFTKCIYSLEAKRKMTHIIKDQNISLVYLLGIVNDISPSVIDACKETGVPVVMRLSDYNILCGSYHFLRNQNLCRECVEKSPYMCTKYKCVKNQFMPSFARSVSMYLHNILNIYDYVSAFVCPCSFMKSSMEMAGFPADKLFQINSFLDPKDYEPCYEHDGYALYFGRVSHEKGIEYLLEAKSLIKTSLPLYIVGGYNDEQYYNSLKKYCVDHEINDVKFIDFMKGDELKKMIRRATFVVAPSIWPDNSPMAVLEALASGKPVIGCDIGGITDQVADNCGYRVPPKNSAALAEKMSFLWSDNTAVTAMGKNARRHFELSFSLDQHYSRLRALFDRCLQQ
ncbi:MAG: glycosyltransferase family 1 protein [Candidatus Auribacter fodinae]|jgi:glycosyltransferase involved in cell wall biosynthesis|uniref:Glycosyltransferase family 1 protein n=1 Tax=Candidatus Auribacter fodinae TaxID=2093366 RepID=A0A3A4QSQ4_9BACT|nr:MAG: glycosyltransferase family 1 protein [Candidatus Auribacter fodinae]